MRVIEEEKIVYIGGVPYHVEHISDLRRKEDGAMLYGDIDHLQQRIQIEADMKRDVQFAALLHEVVHGIFHQSGLDMHIDHSDEESICRVLGYGLLQLIRDNPALITAIMDKKSVNFREISKLGLGL